MVFRAPMRPGARWAIEQGVVAIHPGTDRQVERFASHPDGVFVWTRDDDGFFWLGRIEGPCRSGDFAFGLRHARPATWLDPPFAPDDVPSAVRATFARGGRNFQRTHAAAAERETARRWSEGQHGDRFP